ncbi:DUF2321 domain-containing protein [Paenibacillus sp. AK121]|uniref:DUF2321 domain-containing protein n=1 Tax=Paenibacillus sp. AK121 TaxID=2849670 RepID=UPI001C23A407|nr:DUF2321 domain-containing protein [Paenibacillus sp. AK121]MBU9705906.1 DUF2321 domain-containing protein [Paenibacillus sp. AK121]
MYQNKKTYDIAVVCLNGHLITNTLTSAPHEATRFCSDCGERNIAKCEHCGEPIRGATRVYMEGYTYQTPSFCHSCGHEFPWLTRKLEQADRLVDLIENLTEEERSVYKSDIRELIKDTPKATVAGISIKKLLIKTPQNIKDSLKDILVNVASEAVNKMMLG